MTVADLPIYLTAKILAITQTRAAAVGTNVMKTWLGAYFSSLFLSGAGLVVLPDAATYRRS